MFLFIFGQHAKEEQHRKQYTTYNKNIQIAIPTYIHVEELAKREYQQADSTAHDKPHHIGRDKSANRVWSEVPAWNVILFFDEWKEESRKPQCQDGGSVGYAYFSKRLFRWKAVEVHRIGNQQYVHYYMYDHSFYLALYLFAPQVESEWEQRTDRKIVTQNHHQLPVIIQVGSYQID